jgi:hypothetical protein
MNFCPKRRRKYPPQWNGLWLYEYINGVNGVNISWVNYSIYTWISILQTGKCDPWPDKMKLFNFYFNLRESFCVPSARAPTTISGWSVCTTCMLHERISLKAWMHIHLYGPHWYYFCSYLLNMFWCLWSEISLFLVSLPEPDIQHYVSLEPMMRYVLEWLTYVLCRTGLEGAIVALQYRNVKTKWLLKTHQCSTTFSWNSQQVPILMHNLQA